MANEEHLTILKKGVKFWNQWRCENSSIVPNFWRIELRDINLSNAELSYSNFSMANLSRTKLNKANLKGADFWNASLIKVEFSKANLCEAKLDEANLCKAKLNRANLSGAILCEAILVEADLSKANLNGADLSDADLSGANLCEAKLDWVNFRKTKISSETVISKKWYLVWEILNQGAINRSLNGSDFRDADLIGANFSGYDLSKANFSGSDLSKANFSEANLSRVNFSGANLSGANFSTANLSNSDLRQASLDGANFNKANLFKANLSEVDLRKTNLYGADFREANIYKAELSEVDLREVNFRKANLSRANLSRIQAIGTNFAEAILTGACLEDWNTNSNTNFNDVICSFVYMRYDEKERRPSNGNFAPGEFTKLFQKSLETVDLIFRNGVDWDAFAYSFKKVQVENQGAQLDVKSIENKGDGVLLVRVSVSPDANKEKIHTNIMHGYEVALKALEAQYQASIEGKDVLIARQEAQITRYEGQINRLFDIVEQQGSVQKALAENPRKVSNYDQRNSQFAGGVVDAETVQSHQVGGDIYNTDRPENFT